MSVNNALLAGMLVRPSMEIRAEQRLYPKRNKYEVRDLCHHDSGDAKQWTNKRSRQRNQQYEDAQNSGAVR